MHYKNKDKKFCRTGEISFKWQLTVLPKAVFRTQSEVYGGDCLQK